MKIAGLVKSTLIDYPGKIAAIVFTQGCNFHCGFCHNPDLIDVLSNPTMAEAEVWKFLQKRQGILEGLVITGGEPTIQADLPEFIKRAKRLDYSIKLDTNGSNTLMLRSLLQENLLDFVAMDIKGPHENYQNIGGFSDQERIAQAIDLIMNSGLDYEFRTTALPAYHDVSDFEKVGKMIRGAKRYAVQGFRPKVVYDKESVGEKSFSRGELEQIANIMQKYVSEVVIRENTQY